MPKVGSKPVRVPCVTCDGTGRSPDNKPCKPCQGTGERGGKMEKRS